MAYTSMLFALGFDKFIFGQTPGATSIIGSTLILGSAIYMAMQRDKGVEAQPDESRAGVGQNRDEEAGLMRGTEEREEDEDIIDQEQSSMEMQGMEVRRE
jgi:hypothetical protein